MKWASYTKKSPANSMCCVNKIALSLFLKFSTASLHFSRSESAFTFLKESGHWDFPGGPLVKNLPAHAGDTGSIPGLGRFHTPQRNKVSARQPVNPILKHVLHKRNHRNEKSTHRSWRAAPACGNWRSLQAVTKTQRSQKHVNTEVKSGKTHTHWCTFSPWSPFCHSS